MFKLIKALSRRVVRIEQDVGKGR